MAKQAVSLALAGSGGAGVMTVGAMLLDAAAQAGWYGVFSRLSGAQVRGGEAAALLTLSARPVESAPDVYDLLLAIDWGNVERFAAEIPLSSASIIIGDPKAGETPAVLAASGARRHEVALAELAGKLAGGRPNMVALGLIAGLIGLPTSAVIEVARRRLAEKGAAASTAAEGAIELGAAASGAVGTSFALGTAPAPGPRWLVSGNEASAAGALRGGVRFVAGYPITPATEMLEWMAPHLPRLGGVLVQAEDELAAINMIIGGAYAGAPAMTVTSGPGLSLMVESLGLAVAAEIPVLVVDVQRGGPSTGIPTKSEQSDLDLAVHGAHGDAPHLVVAPLSLADALPTTQWAVELAERLQTPAILLSDQAMGQSKAVIDAPPPSASAPARLVATPAEGEAYRRYANTPSGISPMSAPGTPRGAWVADGLTHNEIGHPSSAARDHHAQLDKRRRKLEAYDFGERWALTEGDGPNAIIAWGSTVGPIREAIARLAAEGIHCRLIAPRILAPVQQARLAAALTGAQRAIVVEQNQTAQLWRLLRGQCELPVALASFARPGPLPFRPAEIVTRLREWLGPASTSKEKAA
jgi:2-oxoglutarate/2-oxoacid ferredoxin oxidoreductase subunit alpha